jgi:hypothetical protein
MNQETLKTLKSSAKVISRELQVLGYAPVSHSHMLQALSKSVGFGSWTALRAVATSPSKPTDVQQASDASALYPKHWVAATYNAGEYIVDVIKWEDPIVNLGYGFYAYDHETHRCLTPNKDLWFEDLDEVPSYEKVRELIGRLEYYAECEVCGHIAELSEELNFGVRCEQVGCTGTLRPFIERRL